MTLQITKAYDRVKAIDWNPSYIETDEKYLEQSRFFVKDLKPVDPFKTFIREYFKMEQEKENRHYSVLEASSRLHQGQAEARWMEGMKFGLSNFAFVEYSAGRQMGRMARSVAPVELRQGYMMQMIDEMRHAQLELNNLRHNMRTWHDPAGYDIALKGAGNNVGSGMFRAMMEDCTTCDPIETAISLQVFLETAYSNVFFVGLSSAAVAQGDHTMASTFLTIQSDEARHMANGWATLVTVLQDDRNVPLSVLLATEPGAKLWVCPNGCDGEAQLLELAVGDMLVFRGDLVHFGAGYDVQHFRIHAYIDPPAHIYARLLGETDPC